MTERQAISSGSRFEELAGYSRAVVDGEWVFISATAGSETDGGFSPDAALQARRALAIIGTALAEAKAGFEDVVRVRVYLADRADVMAVSKILGETFGAPRPTNTTIICGFPDERIKVELEMTALKRR
jgi:enamine deaminase RidA (YjgF/YER057c/UK114 family)